jgi:hypothetical protein
MPWLKPEWLQGSPLALCFAESSADIFLWLLRGLYWFVRGNSVAKLKVLLRSGLKKRRLNWVNSQLDMVPLN